MQINFYACSVLRRISHHLLSTISYIIFTNLTFCMSRQICEKIKVPFTISLCIYLLFTYNLFKFLVNRLSLFLIKTILIEKRRSRRLRHLSLIHNEHAESALVSLLLIFFHYVLFNFYFICVTVQFMQFLLLKSNET